MTTKVPDVKEVLAYYADQAIDDTRPAGILLGLCAALFPQPPGYEFRINPEAEGDDGLFYLGDVQLVCVDDGGEVTAGAVDLLRKNYHDADRGWDKE
jgi:hypothetical protein